MEIVDYETQEHITESHASFNEGDVIKLSIDSDETGELFYFVVVSFSEDRSICFVRGV